MAAASEVCFVVISQDMCDLGVCIRRLVYVVFTGAPGVPDLRSAADPGADRWLSMVTSTIDETVTLLRERILSFVIVQATARKDVRLLTVQATARVE